MNRLFVFIWVFCYSAYLYSDQISLKADYQTVSAHFDSINTQSSFKFENNNVVMSRITIIASLPESIVSAGTQRINVFISLVVTLSRCLAGIINPDVEFDLLNRSGRSRAVCSYQETP